MIRDIAIGLLCYIGVAMLVYQLLKRRTALGPPQRWAAFFLLMSALHLMIGWTAPIWVGYLYR